MKKRNGFVSNSSSSSFIVGIGVITDREKFVRWVESINNDGVRAINPHTELAKSWSDISKSGANFICEAPTNDANGVWLSEDDYNSVETGYEDDIAILCIGHGEGDYAFYDDPDAEWPEISYDIDFGFLPKESQEIWMGFDSDNGISFVDKTFGAGRNG